MPAPFTLEDSGGNNYVDAVTRKINEQGRVFYEVKGRNTTAQQRLVRFYDKNIVKSYVVQDGAELEISAPGRVHKQMQDHLTELLNHFELPSTLNFVSPYTIHDSNGNNYVDSVTRAIDENGAVYYEVRGRNKNNEERIIHLYDNKVVKSYVVTDGIKKPSDKMGQVHQQMHEKMNEILKYFSINRPLNFINPSLKPEVLIPKKPPAIIPSATNEELPTREFFIAAAQLLLGHLINCQYFLDALGLFLYTRGNEDYCSYFGHKAGTSNAFYLYLVINLACSILSWLF